MQIYLCRVFTKRSDKRQNKKFVRLVGTFLKQKSSLASNIFWTFVLFEHANLTDSHVIRVFVRKTGKIKINSFFSLETFKPHIFI